MSQKIKQVIVVRTDLNMRKGKIAAQACHASLKVFLDRSQIQAYSVNEVMQYDLVVNNLTEQMVEWIKESFTKIVVGCKTEEDIYRLARKAEELHIPYAVIVDNGFTEFQGNRTTTCIAIGPDNSDKIDLLTGDYSLL